MSVMVSYVAELQVFSGRPNPRWPLPKGESPRLFELVARLNEPASAVPHRLGYQGVVVYGRRAGLVPWIHANSGTVRVLTGPMTGTYRDTAGIEDWLLAEAERAGLGDILDAALPDRRRIR